MVTCPFEVKVARLMSAPYMVEPVLTKGTIVGLDAAVAEVFH